MSSRGYEVDLIESICENIALAGHLEEIGRDADVSDDLKETLRTALEVRRKQMSRLLEMGEKPNPKYHCVVKHALGAWWRQQEVYEATMDEKDFELTKEMADLTAMCLSKYLGLKFETCQRCFWDALAVREYDKKHQSATIESNGGNENV